MAKGVRHNTQSGRDAGETCNTPSDPKPRTPEGVWKILDSKRNERTHLQTIHRLLFFDVADFRTRETEPDIRKSGKFDIGLWPDLLP
jgi:hypothetical protein